MLNIIKAFIKTGLGSVGTIFFGIMSTKIFALTLGTDGIGLLSILRQFRQTGFSLAGMSGESALVQGISSNHDVKRIEYIKSIFLLFLITSFFISVIIFYFAQRISILLFNSSSINDIFLVRLMIIPVILFVFVAYFRSVLNGYKALGYLAITGVISSAATALLSYPVSYFINQGFDHAFILMMIISSSSSILIALMFLHKSGWLFGMFSRLTIKKWALTHFYIIAISMMITGFVHSGTLLLVKGWIVQQWDISSVGLFDASWTISMIYIGLITKSLSTYYLPALSEIKDETEKVLFIRKVFRIVILCLVPSVVFVISIKGLLIGLLYSSEFKEASLIMRWMLIGDYFKVSSWVLTFPMIAYANMKIFVISGLIWWLLFGISNYFIIFIFNSLEGIGLIYLILYAIYFIFSIVYIKKYHKYTFSSGIILQWLIGLAIIIVASISTWLSAGISWVQLFSLCSIVFVYTWYSITKNEKKIMLKILRRKKH